MSLNDEQQRGEATSNLTPSPLQQASQPSPGLQRQMEIYMAGVQGRKPSQPISIEALEQKAKEVLSPEAYDYLAGGAGSEDTMRANLEAFKQWRIVPNFFAQLVAARSQR